MMEYWLVELRYVAEGEAGDNEIQDRFLTEKYGEC